MRLATTTMGLDLSLSSSGVYVLPPDAPATLCTIATKPADYPTRYDRIGAIVDQIATLVALHRPELVALEEPFVHPAHMSQATNLIALGYAARARLHDMRVAFVSPAPSQVKKFILGKGTGEKSMVLREVYRHWGVEAHDDNQADACVLAYIARAVLLLRAGWDGKGEPKHRADVASKVEEANHE